MSTNDPKSSDPNLNPKDSIKPYRVDPLSTNPHSDPTDYETSQSTYSQSDKTNKDFKTEPNPENIKFKKESSEGKFREKFRNIKDSKQVDDLYNYAVTNKEKTITYTLLALGLILLIFFNELLGGLILGLLAGYYFAEEIVDYMRNLPRLLEGNDQLRYIVLSGVLLGLLITSPGIVLGAAIVAAFKQIMDKKI